MEITRIQKSDGRVVPFDPAKIKAAVLEVLKSAGEAGHDAEFTAQKIAGDVEADLKNKGVELPGVEMVQDSVEECLMDAGYKKTARAYILYRNERTRKREGRSGLMNTIYEISRETRNENANVGNSASAKNFQIGCAANEKFNLNTLIPGEYVAAHTGGDIHIHDLSWYNLTANCIQLPLDRLLQNGFRTRHGWVRPPRRIASASILTAIIMQTSQNDMFGGQSVPFFDTYLAPYAEGEGEKEMFQAMEGYIYNMSMMHSRAGGQVVFSSLNLGTDTSEGGRKVTRNLLQAFNAGLGMGETPIFPNIIFRVQEGVNLNPGDPNYDLFRLALEVSARHMNPTFGFMDSTLNAPYGGRVAYMGCRSRVMANVNGPEVTEGRGNLSFTTINLPRLALRAGDIKDFYRRLQQTVDLVAEQLYHRFRVQADLKVKDLPFVMGQGLYLGSGELDECDRVEPAFMHGTVAAGFIGLAETLQVLAGKHHGESPEANGLGQEIVETMLRRVKEAGEKFGLNYTLLATPAEGLSGRFVKLDKKEFGIIPGVTDKDYYTNSFHVPVSYPVSAAEKIEIEGPYHKYCDAGHISYVELEAPPEDNPEAVEAIVRHMHECNMGYAGINFPIDICTDCGQRGVINGECPACGSGRIRMIRRITGYLSTVDRFNAGKKAELQERTTHAVKQGSQG